MALPQNFQIVSWGHIRGKERQGNETLRASSLWLLWPCDPAVSPFLFNEIICENTKSALLSG